MHITKEQLNDYMSDKISQTEQMDFLKHISGCEFCAGKLAEAIQKRELIPALLDLKDNILKQTVYKKNTSMVNLSWKTAAGRTGKKQKEFWTYTAKVAFAVCATVTMIMMPADTLPKAGINTNYREAGFSLTKEITEEDVKSSLKILDFFRDTSAKISDDVSRALKLDRR